jgi:hypothetical protein
MVNYEKSWALGLFLLTGALALWSPSAESSARAEVDQAALRLAAEARAERLQDRHLQCLAERETLAAAIAERRLTCEAEMQEFYECRAERPELQGAELWNCGLGLAMGVASHLSSEARTLSDCGLAEPPEARRSCPVPACSLDAAEIEREVLTERGLSAVPSCDDPSA